MFSEGHDNGIVEAILIDRTRRNRYGFNDTVIMCVKTVLCIKLYIQKISKIYNGFRIRVIYIVLGSYLQQAVILELLAS